MKVVVLLLSVILLGSVVHAADGAAPERLMYDNRDQIPLQYRWDLSAIYPSREACDTAAETLPAEIAKLATFTGRLGSSPATLAEALDLYHRLGLVVDDLYVYASQLQHTDTRDAAANHLQSRAEALRASFSAAGAFVRPEIAKLPPEVLDRLAADDQLASYRHYLDDIARSRAQIRPAEVEAVLAGAALLENAPAAVYSSLTNADIQWPSITGEDGKQVSVVPAQFYTFMSSPDRRVRQDAAKALFGTYDSYANTLAGLYSASVAKDLWLARTRGYGSTLEAALDKDNIPRVVLDNLVATVQANYGDVHRYVELRKKVLKLDDFHLYDLYVPITPGGEPTVSYDEGWQLAMQFWTETFGPEYAAVAERAKNERWIDVYTNSGKRGGAYSWGTYRTHPYLLLNWGGKLEDVFTLVHEMGHSIHTYLASKHQAPHDAGYTMFVAEVASVASESLFFEWMMARTDDPARRLAMLNHRLNGITGTFLRQVYFHQYEAHAHAMADAGQPLTKESLGDVWAGLYSDFYGPAATLDPAIRSDWGRIPHFYRTFYVWVYATSFAAGEAIAERFRAGDRTAVDDYLETLKLGGSVYPMEAVARAGVDMSRREVMETVMVRFREIVTEMEKILVPAAG